MVSSSDWESELSVKRIPVLKIVLFLFTYSETSDPREEEHLRATAYFQFV